MPETLSDTLNRWAELSVHRSMFAFHQFVRSRGLSMPQVMVLMRLHHGGACAVSEISQHLEVSPPAASQLVHRLVEQGLVARREDPDDRRVKTISLTQAGRSMVEAAILSRHEWIDKLAAHLPDDRQEEIAGALRLLVQAVEEDGKSEGRR